MYVITIPEPVPSSNNWTFKTRWAYKSIRDKWYEWIQEAIAGVNCDVPKTNYKTHAVILCKRQRLLDWGNFVAGSKPIPDAFKHLGLAIDDDPPHWSCHYVQLKTKHRADQLTTIAWDYELIS